MKKYGQSFFIESKFSSRNQYFGNESLVLNEYETAKNRQEEAKKYDVFLSHSSKDKIIILNFKQELKQRGYSAYIDWVEDSDYGRDKIAPKLKTAMSNSKVLIYIHTQNTVNSKWTPWEIGYFDNDKGPDRIGIVPFLNSQSRIPPYSGQEYLELYNQIGADYLDSFIKNAGVR